MFAWADDGAEVKVDVPVVIKGEDASPGLKKGKLFLSSHWQLWFFYK